jgi:hypothetical protein
MQITTQKLVLNGNFLIFEIPPNGGIFFALVFDREMNITAPNQLNQGLHAKMQGRKNTEKRDDCTAIFNDA